WWISGLITARPGDTTATKETIKDTSAVAKGAPTTTTVNKPANSDAPKAKTGTFVVGPDSTHPTLAVALAAAGPGSTIVVRAADIRDAAILTSTHQGLTLRGEPEGGGLVRWLPPPDHATTTPLLSLESATGVTIRGFEF